MARRSSVRRLLTHVQAAACAVLLAVGLAAAGPGGTADARTAAHASIGFEPTPLSLATDAVGHVFLSNPVSSTRIDEYSPDGALLGSRGTFALSGGFDETRDIATDAAGNLWVADGAARKVVELGADGTVLRGWSAQGRGIAVSSAGDVYTAGPTEVARYSAAGIPISTWASPEGLVEVLGIATGPEGLIYVADTYGDTVQVFEPDGSLVRAWAVGGPVDGPPCPTASRSRPPGTSTSPRPRPIGSPSSPRRAASYATGAARATSPVASIRRPPSPSGPTDPSTSRTPPSSTPTTARRECRGSPPTAGS